MDHDYDLRDWLVEENAQYYNKENRSRHFSIGFWQGEASEVRELTHKQSADLVHDSDHNQWRKLAVCDHPHGVGTPRNDSFHRHRTHSDNDPLNDVTNRASIDFSVNRLSLDNVLSDISNPVDSGCNIESPGNSSDSVKFDILSQVQENQVDRSGRSPMFEQLSNSQNEIANGRFSPRVMKPINYERTANCLTEPQLPRRQRRFLVNEARLNVTDMPRVSTYERLYEPGNPTLREMRYAESENVFKQNDATYDVTSFEKPRRPIVKSQSTNSSPTIDYFSRLSISDSNQEFSNAQRMLPMESKRLPTVPSLMVKQRRSHGGINMTDALMTSTQSVESLRRASSGRQDTLSFRNTKKKYPPEYFSHADRFVFEFFKEYKLPVVLTYSQRLLAESAAGIRNQLPQTDDNPFKHLPLHCIKGVLNGLISALDFGVYWQWLSDTVNKNSLRSMMTQLLLKCPFLVDYWRHALDGETCRHARLIDHICHVLMVASESANYSEDSRQGKFLAACKRAIDAERNPAPLNHDFICVALAPLLGHDPLLLEKVLCAIPRYKMSFSQMFGSYGTGSGEFTEPSGLAVLKDGRLAVVDTNQHRIMIFREDKNLDVCFSSDEDAMHKDKMERAEFEKQQMRSGSARNRRWNGYLMYPNRAAVDMNTGHLVLTERAPHPQVQVFTEDGRFVRRFGEGFLENPRGLCVDHLSRIIVVECKIMRVTIWCGTQLQKDFIATDLGFPNSIAADTNCRLYITDNEAHCVRIFAYSGQPLGSVGGPGLTNFPVAVRLRISDGAICVFDNHNNFNMTVFTSEGALLEARESEIKHAQIHDVQLRPSDGAVIQAGKDYRVYVYKPYPFFLRGRDQRSPHLMSSYP